MKKHPLILCAGITSLFIECLQSGKSSGSNLTRSRSQTSGMAENGNLCFCTFRT